MHTLDNSAVDQDMITVSGIHFLVTRQIAVRLETDYALPLSDRTGWASASLLHNAYQGREGHHSSPAGFNNDGAVPPLPRTIKAQCLNSYTQGKLSLLCTPPPHRRYVQYDSGGLVSY
jgi:hypothetical protein